MTQSKKTLKMFLTMESLDYKGNVVTYTRSKDIEWYNYDPKVFIENTMLSGEVSDNLSPIKDETYFLEVEFDLDFSDCKNRRMVVESEGVNGMKYVYVDNIKNIKKKWVEA